MECHEKDLGGFRKNELLVEPTHSNWAIPTILVEKKEGTHRLLVDYRGLNGQIKRVSWSLPKVSDVVDSLDDNMIFSHIDLISGYF